MIEVLKEHASLVTLVLPVLAAAILWWLSQRFAPRSRVEDLAVQMQAMVERLTAMDAAVKGATLAAGEARSAAEKALMAAEEMRVGAAELNGRINLLTALLERIERSGDLVLRGHLNLKGS